MRTILAAIIAAALTGGARAEAPPCDIIKIISPYTAGGATDVLTRVVMEPLGQALNRSFVLENRAGGGSNIGSSFVAKSRPDGCTLLVNGTMLATFPYSYPDLNYDPMKDLIPIGGMAATPTILVSGSKDKSLGDFVNQSKSDPKGVSFAIGGVGLLQHLAVEAIARNTRSNFVPVPYPGSPTAIADMLSNRVDFGSFTFGAMSGLVEAGSLKGLAMVQDKRTPLAPQIPALPETGFESVDARVQFIMFAPAGTPSGLVKTLESELKKLIEKPETREAFFKIAFEPTPATGDEVRAWMDKTARDWEPIVKGLKK
jgi:tripartite-type tricarboxylate transporter receptor subunit TctC